MNQWISKMDVMEQTEHDSNYFRERIGAWSGWK